MEGACSNQIVKCIVYSNDSERGWSQLLKIESQYNSEGIKTISKRYSKNTYSEIVFDNGEEWVVVKPANMARGYRWRKAYVDVGTVTMKEKVYIIDPCGDSYKLENCKTFGWEY